MDPNACVRRILDAIDNGQDADEFVSAFQDLADWLAKGGFPPVVQSLGTVRRRIHGDFTFRYETVQRRTLTDRPFVNGAETHAIQTVNPNADGPPFEFITYRGDTAVARYELA
jgi:hypothetical protein